MPEFLASSAAEGGGASPPVGEIAASISYQFQTLMQSLQVQSHPLLDVVAEGPGSRGLVAVDDATASPVGPTMRDSAGESGVRVGQVEEASGIGEGTAFGLWWTMDPLRVAADHALEIAEARLAAK